MDKLLQGINKIVCEYDREIAADYVSYYGIEPGEEKEYFDEFLSDCYELNEQTGEYEPREIYYLPFVSVKKLEDDLFEYEYNGRRVITAKKY